MDHGELHSTICINDIQPSNDTPRNTPRHSESDKAQMIIELNMSTRKPSLDFFQVPRPPFKIGTATSLALHPEGAKIFASRIGSVASRLELVGMTRYFSLLCLSCILQDLIDPEFESFIWSSSCLLGFRGIASYKASLFERCSLSWCKFNFMIRFYRRERGNVMAVYLSNGEHSSFQTCGNPNLEKLKQIAW